MLLFLAAMLAMTTGAWAQTDDYSGTYFIGSRGYTTPVPSPNTNYYLCPTEEWAFYVATNNVTGTDNGQPFLTTYQCQNVNKAYDARKAVWTLVKHPTETNCYYIIQTLTGKYVVSNGMLTGAGSTRARVHLETVSDAAALAALGDWALFEITYDGGHYDIMPHSTYGRDGNNIYLVVNNNNGDQLDGNNSKTNGPTGFKNCGGIIGLYTHPDGGNAYFYLESAPSVTAAPTITNNFDGTVSITAASGTIYYTTDGTTPTTSSSTYSTPITLTDAITVIKAMAKEGSDYESLVVTYELPQCETPVITVSSGTVTITTATVGASIRYTNDDTPVTSSSTLYNDPFSMGAASVISAVAFKVGYAKSGEAFYMDFKTVHSSSEITNMGGMYILASDFTSSASIGTALEPFYGTIDGQLNTVSDLTYPLVAYANGATIKNVILDNVILSGGTNVGAICGEASGATRIYNCGVLATGSTVEKDDDGYDEITSCSSTVSGSGFVGGIVGLLDDSSRVINCFSYANITGGTYRGGIVGKNNVSYDHSDYKTMVMNCMFYGEIAATGSPTQIAPVYGGEIITNDGDDDGVNNFNYFRIEASYIKNTAVTKTYNCALGAETRFLQRFEFFRHLLNSNRELAAWWATGDVANKDEIKKWVMEPTQIGTTTPYPILKTAGKYASVVNYTPSETVYDEAHRCQGRKLTSEGDGGVLHVTIQLGTNTGSTQFSQPTGAAFKDGEDGSVDLTITDKDTAHFNFNYGKVQLPYYNDYCDGNYTDSRVVTGWKIVSITGGTAAGYSTGAYDVTYTDGELTAMPYNFADRNCTNKDLYDAGSVGSDRVFSQGAYWDVPVGVTAITIEPYWAKAVYLSDAYWDVTYQNSGSDAMVTAVDVTTVGGGQRYDSGVSTFNSQLVYTTMASAVTALNPSTSHTVNDYAVVLVGNYHQYGSIEGSGRPYTVMSVDNDGDDEPDYSFMLRFNARTGFHPVKYDFLNLIGLGMAQKTTGGTGSYNLGIMQPKGWFEVTNTALFRVTQFEYSPGGRAKKPYILQGGVIEQWVTQQNDAGDLVEYFHVGGNVWFKEFHRGSHQDNANKSTPHPPLSVTGGDYDEFYLTGLYQSQAAIYDDNAECYINGGRFGVIAGAGMEGIGTSDGKGNITWVIDNADIQEFYGGGINYDKPAHGNIHTIISNSYVDVFCGGPKFGNMVSERTVKTTATDCTFGTYFGAGYGGNAYNRYAPSNQNNKINIDWNTWVTQQYKQDYSSTYKGVSTRINYQFIPMSGNVDNVCRLWVEYVSFSLAQCNDVTSTLTGCTVTGNYYGGGSLGKVTGTVSSTLDGCTVRGNVFGAGYSASLPTVEVDSIGFRSEPFYYTDLGTYRTAEKGATTTYTWEHAATVNNIATAIDKTNHILYTTVDISNTNLGSVATATLTLTGSTTVGTFDGGGNLASGGNVYGGGDESAVGGNATVILQQGTHVGGNVFGGGNRGTVGGNSSVTIQDPEP